MNNLKSCTIDRMQWGEHNIVSIIFLPKVYITWIESCGMHHTDPVGDILQNNWLITVVKVINSTQTVTKLRERWSNLPSRNLNEVGGSAHHTSSAGTTSHAQHPHLPLGWYQQHVYPPSPCLFLTCFLPGHVFYYFWILWSVTSNQSLTSDFLSMNLGLKYASGSWASQVGYPRL